MRTDRPGERPRARTPAAVATCILALLGVVPAAAAAQTAPAADVEAGRALFAGLCVTCHGFEGRGGEAPPLDRPRLTSAPDEASLRQVISEGIPNRGMPRVRRTTENELRALVAYVRSIGQRPRSAAMGDPRKGAALYGSLGCAACHIVAGQGGSFGPPLTDIGRLRGADYLRQAVLEPGAALPKGTLPIPARGYREYLPVRVVTADGRDVRGIRLNEDVFTIQIRDVGGRIHSFRKSAARSIQKEDGISLMPGYGDRVRGTDLDDLVAYLASLGGGQ